MNDLIVVRMTLVSTGLKTVWQYGDAGFPPYTLDVDLLRRLGEHVRVALGGLVTAARVNPQEVPVALARVAAAGQDLRDGLFTADDQEQADEVAQWLSNLRHPVRITFSVDPRVHIPFGLICEHGVSPVDDAGFWSTKYRVATVYSRLDPVGLGPPADPAQFRVLLALNEHVVGGILHEVPETEAATWTQLTTSALASVHSSKALVQTWPDINDRVGIVYFLCHASGTRLAFSAHDELSIDRLRVHLKRRKALGRPPCLVILNGCATAVGSREGGFLEATGAQGFCGFVGTETGVPDVFAFRFGQELLARLLHKGELLVDALAHLRRAHFPLSLVYGLYAYPLLRARVDEPSFVPPVENYSTGTLGHREL